MNFIELKSGKSVEGSEITAFRNEIKSDKYLYLMAGVHGDEVEGVYVLQQLKEWLEEQENIDIPIILIPILNVDGYRVATRTNANGVDLNRNLPSKGWQGEASEAKYFPGKSALSEPENKYLVKLFNKFTPRFIITFHSWKPMINYNGDCLEVAEFINKYNGYEVADDIGYSTPGSLGEYGPETFQAPVITFECPLISEGKTLKEIWDENAEGFKDLLKSDILK